VGLTIIDMHLPPHIASALKRPAAHRQGSRLPLVLLAGLGILCPSARGAAQETKQPPRSIEQRQAEKADREAELKAIEGAIRQSDEDKLKAIREVESLRGDRAKLNAALIETTRKVRANDMEIAAIEAKLALLEDKAATLRDSLERRRGLMVEVLAALQRLGRKPPPAVLVRPDDILAAVRAAILLGGVLPELREEAQRLARDLAALVDNRRSQTEEREKLVAERRAIAADRERLTALVSARQDQIESSEQRLKSDRAKITQLARQAQSLKDLITRMESDIAGASRAAEAARKVPLPSGNNGIASQQAALSDPARLQPKIAFADLKGALPLPAAGPVLRSFGDPDGFGGTEKGITIEPPPSAIISAPNDGWVAFSGVYRSYGQVLILNAGNGYHLLLIGVDHALVDVGQFVLAGEPIAVMATGSSSGGAAGRQGAGKKSTLYIELRKDGQPIDSGPWWAQSLNEKARG